ncbi:transcription and mRNA export factor ENY2-like isoform X1 [Tachypleus tridentatus]|uniref:transcription and mRNA export factor ENY2-like isoform X1 n=1 Tax=Tachypleus tridentatus TaxID=6853 RepID=UPI003FCFB3DD
MKIRNLGFDCLLVFDLGMLWTAKKWHIQKRWSDNTSPQDKKLKDLQMKTAVNQKLIETGERERLRELLRTRLIECGWKDQMKAYCKDIVKEKGVENVTVDDLVAEITPKGRALVPDAVKRELLQRIRTFLAQQTKI